MDRRAQNKRAAREVRTARKGTCRASNLPLFCRCASFVFVMIELCVQYACHTPLIRNHREACILSN